MIPTAEEFFEDKLGEDLSLRGCSALLAKDLAIEFAKLHLKAALEAVSEKIKLKDLNEDNQFEVDENGGHYEYYVVDKDSILNAYPENLIK